MGKQSENFWLTGLIPKNYYQGEGKMKKILAISALVASIGFGALSAEAKAPESSSSSAIGTTANAVNGQIRVQIGGRRNRNWRRARTVTRTRIVGFGRNRYRETIQTRYLPNGRTTTRVISRVRVR
jgi:hypothetical protein